MRRYRELTADEITALRTYAEQHGQKWKNHLRADWFDARLNGLLHALRNTHGPSWLMSFQLPN
jgi:hypothetical protein